MLNVAIDGKPGGAEVAVVWLVTFMDQAQVTVERGENAGQTGWTTRRWSPAGRCWACGIRQPARI